MAVLGCQPISLFPAWSCQWKSCWKNSRKELSFLHSIDQVNTLPRVSLKRPLWCFRVEKCILNAKRCLVIFKIEHENAQQKVHGTAVCAWSYVRKAVLGRLKVGTQPGIKFLAAANAGSLWKGEKQAITDISSADCATFHSTLDTFTKELNPLMLTQPVC